jgi:peptide/nickel transport system substrate-binding protein
MKLKWSLVLLLAITLVLGGCAGKSSNGGSSSQGKQLIVSIPSDAGTLDPGVSMDNSAWKITYPTYEKLVAYDGSKTTVKPSLAKSWEISDDGLTYTFHLEKGHKFSDGTPVDANAVKFSFERTLKIAKGPSDLYSIIKNITVVDDYTVKFELKNNFPPFISTLAANYGGIVNPKVKEHEQNGDLGQNYLASHTMGSGPYELSDYKKGQYYKLTVNKYSKVKPKIQTVYFQISTDVSGERLKLKKGEIDIAEGIPTDQIKELENTEGITVVKQPSLLVDYVYMNIGKGNKALKNKTFRQGLSEAIDYQSIINQTMQGFASEFRGPVPKGLWGHDPNAKMYTYNKEDAKKLIDQSGFAGTELNLLYSDHLPYWEQLALAIQSNLKDVGVKVKLTKVAYATMRDKIDAGDFDLCLGVWSPDYGDPYMFMNYWFDSSNWGLAGNRSFYKNDQVDQLVRKAASISDQNERAKLYKQAQDIINEDAVYIYLDQREFALPMRSNVKGFVYNPMLEGIYNLAEMSK